MDAMDIPGPMKRETSLYVNFLVVFYRPGHCEGFVLLRHFPDGPLSAIETVEEKLKLIKSKQSSSTMKQAY